MTVPTGTAKEAKARLCPGLCAALTIAEPFGIGHGHQQPLHTVTESTNSHSCGRLRLSQDGRKGSRQHSTSVRIKLFRSSQALIHDAVDQSEQPSLCEPALPPTTGYEHSVCSNGQLASPQLCAAITGAAKLLHPTRGRVGRAIRTGKYFPAPPCVARQWRPVKQAVICWHGTGATAQL